jgi:hypothetical protein
VGIQTLSPTRYRVFVDLGRDAQGKRLQYTCIVHGDRAEAVRVEAELVEVRDSVTSGGEDRNVLVWLQGFAEEANRRAREVADEQLAIGLVDLACLVREIVWNLDRSAPATEVR